MGGRSACACRERCHNPPDLRFPFPRSLFLAELRTCNPTAAPYTVREREKVGKREKEKGKEIDRLATLLSRRKRGRPLGRGRGADVLLLLLEADSYTVTERSS